MMLFYPFKGMSIATVDISFVWVLWLAIVDLAIKIATFGGYIQ